jgi:hypothetical protein
VRNEDQVTRNQAAIELLQSWMDEDRADLSPQQQQAWAEVQAALTGGDVREQLAAYAHNAWAGWMMYLFNKAQAHPDGTVTIPAWAVARWQRQMHTAYADLPEAEKASDRAEADKMLALMGMP